MNNKFKNFDIPIDFVKSIFISFMFLVSLGVLSFIFCFVMDDIIKDRDMSAYYAVKEDYYYKFKPSGETEYTWYKYDSNEDDWNQIEKDDLPYHLAIKDLKNDHWYCNTWEEGSPFSDFRESESFEKYLSSKVS